MSTFDLAEVLQGRGYPSDTLAVYLDEESAYLIQAQREIISTLQGDELLAAQDALDAFVEKAKLSAYTFHLKGRSRIVIRDIAKRAWSEVPDKPNDPGRLVIADAREELRQALEWEAFIEKVVAPDGSENEFSLEDVQLFRQYAPQASLVAIERKIESLKQAGAGFEYISQSADFS